MAAAQSRRPATLPALSGIVPKLSSSGGITIRLVSIPGGALITGGESGDGTLDLGNLSYFSSSHAHATAQNGRSFSTATSEFGIELDSLVANSTGTAMLSAYLAQPRLNCKYFIDGIPLTTAPQIISVGVRYGVVSKHRLEIQVPTTAPAGAIHASIVWTATPEE